MSEQTYRIPPEVTNPLDKESVQVNHCRMPDCDNYGIAAKVETIKPGPNKDGDKHYKITSTNKGVVPAVVCKSCGEKSPIKSNQGIVSEVNRITNYLKAPEDKCCTNNKCDNHDKSVSEYPKAYAKHGYQNVTKNPLRRCKLCNTSFVLSTISAAKIYPDTQHLASDIYSRIINKSPVRRTLRGIGTDSKGLYYTMTRFIQRRCSPIAINPNKPSSDKEKLSSDFNSPDKNSKKTAKKLR